MKYVLVVEDSAELRSILVMALQFEGYEVQEAANGKEAIAVMAKNGQPGLIVLDLMMPVMSGWEFLEHRKVTEELSKVPVVVCSAVPEPGVQDALVLKKPLDLDTLTQVISRYAG